MTRPIQFVLCGTRTHRSQKYSAQESCVSTPCELEHHNFKRQQNVRLCGCKRGATDNLLERGLGSNMGRIGGGGGVIRGG